MATQETQRVRGEAQWEVSGHSCWKHHQEVSPAQEKRHGLLLPPWGWASVSLARRKVLTK